MSEQKHQHHPSSHSTLMSMPNELLDFCLIYLSSCEILQSLSNLNQRLNCLIYRFIHTIDVTCMKKFWLNKHFFPVQPLVTKLVFNHCQLKILFPTPPAITTRYPSLQSIVWNYRFGDDNRRCQAYLKIFRRQLSSIHLILSSDDDETVHNDVALLLLQDDSLLTHVSFQASDRYIPMWFSFAPDIVKVNTHLKRLTIRVHYTHDLFILVQGLLALESLNVDVCEVERNDLYDYRGILSRTDSLSPVLKELAITSLALSYPRLLLFVQAFRKSIERLTVNVLIEEQVNGEIIESTIVSKMPKLEQFKFIFQIEAEDNVNINKGLDKLISTFRSTPYWLAHPVMCYHDRSQPCFTVVSLPWIWKESDALTHEIMNYRVNTAAPLQMPEVHSLYLASATITSDFLEFIKTTFTKLRKLVISWHTCKIDEKVIYGKKRVKLNTVTTLKYYGDSEETDYIDFFQLTPNLRRLMVDGETVDMINGYVRESRRLAATCKKISSLHIFRRPDYWKPSETKRTFPNALISTKAL